MLTTMRAVVFFSLQLLAFSVCLLSAQAQFNYTTNNGAITITGYTGSGGAVVIPGAINSLPVTAIGPTAFAGVSLSMLTIPDSVTNIGSQAFSSCAALTAVYLQGNAPSADATVFSGDNNATVYHLPETTGWGDWFGGRPTALYGWAVDAFNPDADGAVFAMAVQTDGKIVVGGAFTTLAGQPRNHIARLNADGTLDPGFNPNADGDVVSLNVQEDGKILVGGSFTHLGGIAQSHIARLNANGTLDLNFNPSADDNVSALALQADGRIVVAGNFSMLNGQARRYIGRLNNNGTLDTTFAPEPDSYVNGLAVQGDGKILVGGGFTNLAGSTCLYLGRLNGDGTLDSNFVGGANGPVELLAVQADGRITVAGSFTSLSGVWNAGIGRLSADGILQTGNPGVNFPVESLAVQANGNILLGGGNPYQLGRLNGMFSLDSSFALPTDAEVSCLAVQPDGAILVGGSFQTIAGKSRSRIARVLGESLATQSLTYDGTNVTWLRYGANPMVWRTSFDISTNGTDWAHLGAGVHIPNGWQVTAPALPNYAIIRARGFVQGGFNDASGWFVETTLEVATPASQFTYITNANTVTITGYTGPGGAVYIPSAINGLAVTDIGTWAFGTANLSSLMMPSSITSIGPQAFAFSKLTSVTIGKAFMFRTLTNVTMGNGVSTIGDNAFLSCRDLTKVEIPNSVTSIGTYAFQLCSSLASILIPPNVTSIGGYAFSYCLTLTNITIPDGVTSIGGMAFRGCPSLASVTIGKNVNSIGDAAFSECGKLSAITVDAKNVNFSEAGGVLFNKDQTTLHSYPEGKARNYTIPGSVISIREFAFEGCTNLSSVIISKSVTSIGAWAFYGCSNLVGVYFESNAPHLGPDAFDGDNNATAYYLSGTTGWGTMFGAIPTRLWLLPNPLILNNGPKFGVLTNRFGFVISWATNVSVVVEACTDLANPIWSPLGTNTLTGGSSYFSDSQWTNHPNRFYRLRSP
jgi:uncharacterized delta-60 repeat protein